MEKWDIETAHIEDQLLVKDINYIQLNKTPYITLTEDIEINFLMEINEIYTQETAWSIPLSKSDFIFEWDVEMNDVVDSVPTNIEMSVTASPDSERATGSDEYEFVITEDNLYIPISKDNNIYGILGIVIICLFVFAGIAWLISAFMKGGK